MKKKLKSDSPLRAATGSGSPVLATRDGVSLVFGLLLASGSMCDECGYATRKTSKNWAVCKKCGKRISRCEISEVKVTHDGQNAEPIHGEKDA